MDGDGLIAVGEAGTDEGQFDFTTVGEQALRRAIGCLRLEAQGLDPQTGWIDDLKDDRTRTRNRLEGLRRASPARKHPDRIAPLMRSAFFAQRLL